MLLHLRGPTHPIVGLTTACRPARHSLRCRLHRCRHNRAAHAQMRLIKGCKRLNARAAAAALADARETPLGRAVILGEAHVALRELLADRYGSDRFEEEHMAVGHVRGVGEASWVDGCMDGFSLKSFEM